MSWLAYILAAVGILFAGAVVIAWGIGPAEKTREHPERDA